jgi:hypothetical protein
MSSAIQSYPRKAVMMLFFFFPSTNAVRRTLFQQGCGWLLATAGKADIKTVPTFTSPMLEGWKAPKRLAKDRLEHFCLIIKD